MFRLADTSGDEVLDEKEIEALVHRQAERVHAAKHGAAVDMAAIAEEAARMREHMMELMDMDHDRLVSYKEFMDATKTESFKQDAGWQPVNPNEEIKDKVPLLVCDLVVVVLSANPSLRYRTVGSL